MAYAYLKTLLIGMDLSGAFCCPSLTNKTGYMARNGCRAFAGADDRCTPWCVQPGCFIGRSTAVVIVVCLAPYCLADQP